VVREISPVLADSTGVRARRLARFGRAIALLCLLWIAGLGLAGLGILPAGDLPLGHAHTGIGSAVHHTAPAPAPARRSELVPVSPANEGTANAGTASLSLDSAAQVNHSVSWAKSVALNGSTGGAGAGRGHGGSIVIGRSGSSASGGVVAPMTGVAGTNPPAANPGSAGSTAGTAGGATGTAGGGVAATSGGGTRARDHGKVMAGGQAVKQSTHGHTSVTGPEDSGTAPGQLRRTTISATKTTATTTPGQSGASHGHAVTHGSGHGNGT
jgi:hypothetical protein